MLALSFGLAQFSRLREDWLRLSKEIFGHRLMMDGVIPGGVAVDPIAPMRDRMCPQCEAISGRCARATIYDEHAACRIALPAPDRVTAELARATRPDRPGRPRQRSDGRPA